MLVSLWRVKMPACDFVKTSRGSTSTLTLSSIPEKTILDFLISPTLSNAREYFALFSSAKKSGCVSTKYLTSLPYVGTLRRLLHHADYALNDVVDVSEIALAVAIIENLDCVALNEFVCETKIRHVGATCRAINCEETQTCSRDIIELAVTMRKELVALFGGSIEAHGVVHPVFHTEGHLGVATIDAA